MVKKLAPLVALLVAMGYADYADILDAFIQSIPIWVQGTTLIISAASILAAATPWSWDNRAVRWVKAFLDSLGFNFGRAENKEEKEL